METATNTAAVQQYLTFLVGGEEYAIGILQVREIIEWGNVTRVPSTPKCVRGVINLRGSVLPVVDPSVKFGSTQTEPTKQTCIVVVETELDGQASVIGIMADAVNQVIELRDEQIQPPPSFGTRVQLDFLRGLGEVEGGFVLILNLDRLLTTEELLKATAATDERENRTVGVEEPAALPPVADADPNDSAEAAVP